MWNKRKGIEQMRGHPGLSVAQCGQVVDRIPLLKHFKQPKQAIDCLVVEIHAEQCRTLAEFVREIRH